MSPPINEAANVRVIWDRDHDGWYVRYNKPSVLGIDVDETMYMPDDPNITEQELKMYAEMALQFVGLSLPANYEIVRGY